MWHNTELEETDNEGKGKGLPVHVMQAKERAEVYPYSFLTSALDWMAITIYSSLHPRQRTSVPV